MTMQERAERKVQDELANDLFFVERMHRYEDEARGVLRMALMLIVAGALLGFVLSVWGIL